MNGASTEPFVKTASAPYTTAMIISGNNQNFFRLIAKRQSWPIVCTFGLRFDPHCRETNPKSRGNVLKVAYRTRFSRSHELSSDHDEQAPIGTSRQQHFDFGGEAIKARPGPMRREYWLIFIELDVPDGRNAR